MEPREDSDLVYWLADAARALEAAGGSQATLEEACQRAVAVIAGCRYATISEDRAKYRGEILAASDDLARTLHDLQYELGDGPCLDAIWKERVVWAGDLAAEDRWPGFAPKAVSRGVRSILVVHLYTREDTYGALNLFSDEVGAFDEVTREVAQVFAAHAAIAIAAARENAQMSDALLTRQRIGQATGILAERHELTTDEAFAMLVKASQSHNSKLRDIAARVVTSEDAARRRDK